MKGPLLVINKCLSTSTLKRRDKSCFCWRAPWRRQCDPRPQGVSLKFSPVTISETCARLRGPLRQAAVMFCHCLCIKKHPKCQQWNGRGRCQQLGRKSQRWCWNLLGNKWLSGGGASGYSNILEVGSKSRFAQPNCRASLRAQHQWFSCFLNGFFWERLHHPCFWWHRWQCMEKHGHQWFRVKMLLRGERFLLTVKKFEECLIVFLAFIFIIGGSYLWRK